MVEFRKNAARDKLYALAVENGVEVAEDADRDAIITALTAHNEKEAAEQTTEGAGNAAEGGEGNSPTPGANGGETPTEGGEDPAGSGTNGGGDGTPAEEATEGAERPAEGGGGNDTPGEEKPTEQPTGAAEGYDTFVYVGPSIPRGRLKENAVFRGTLADVLAYLADVVEKYPQIPRLIVPTSKLAAFSVKVKTPGNIAHKYYSDIASAIRRGKEV